MKQTRATRVSEIKRGWHLVDAKSQILGRLSSDIALLLMGKNKSNFVRNLDLGDYVVVLNAKLIEVTGKKETAKKYYRHSGFPGGFRTETLQELRNRRPTEIITRAVAGMLPQNKLKKQMLNRLYVFENEEHNYVDKFKVKEKVAEVTKENEPKEEKK